MLILDEPTAHLDPDSRRALTRDLLAATAGRATLLITHDLEGLDQVDEIIVLREGKVVRRGSYAQCRRANILSQMSWSWRARRTASLRCAADSLR